jgi:hypothetical protein
MTSRLIHTGDLTYTGEIGSMTETRWIGASDPVPPEIDFDDLMGFGPDAKAMIAKRPGWYTSTGHDYRLWGPPTARRLRTLSRKTIKRKMRRAHRQGRHIHACDLAHEDTSRPRADAAADRRRGQALARQDRRRKRRIRAWVRRVGPISAVRMEWCPDDIKHMST